MLLAEALAFIEQAATAGCNIHKDASPVLQELLEWLDKAITSMDSAIQIVMESFIPKTNDLVYVIYAQIIKGHAPATWPVMPRKK